MNDLLKKVLLRNPYANFIRKHPFFTTINVLLGGLTPIFFLLLMLIIKDIEKLLFISKIFIIISIHCIYLLLCSVDGDETKP